MGRSAGQWQQVHHPDHYAALSAEQRFQGIVPDGRYRFRHLSLPSLKRFNGYPGVTQKSSAAVAQAGPLPAA